MRKTAENYVSIRIKATDTAKPDLDSLRADLDELGSKVDTAKVEVDDDEAKLKLLEINAQLAALNKRVANPKIDTASAARAESQIEKLKGDVDDLVKKVDSSNSSSGGRGLLGKLLFGAAGEAGGAGGSGALGGLKDVLPFGGNPAALAGIAGAIGAALVEIDALASGFAAAGVGVGAFAALAIPAFDKVKTAYSGIAAAQAAYHKAQLTESMDPTKANAAAVAKSLLNLKEAWHGLDPAERGAVRGLQEFEGTWQRMSKAFEPEAFKVFNQGLKIANELLPQLKPFADTAANAISGLLKQAAGFFRVSTPVSSLARGLGLVHDKTQSILTPFGQWLKQFHQLEGPSLRAIGEGLGHVTVNMGKLLTIMSKKDVVNGINIAFSILDGTLIAVRGLIRGTMVAFDAFNTATAAAGRAVDALVHIIASGFGTARANIHRWADDAGRDTMDVVHWFEALPGRILGALSSLGGQLFSAGAHAIAMLASGIRSAIGDVTGAIGSVVSEITSHLPFSPAKKGPLSGRGDPVQAGRRISQMLAQGMTDGTSVVSHAADRVAGAAVMGGHGGGGGRPIQLEVRVPRTAMILGTDFWTAFQNGVRAKGGDPRIVQAKVVFQ